MDLRPGTRIGPYEVISLVGAGGMGEVYRGREPRLQRDVALKILPEAFASDPDRLARFEREARTLAALSDPHIAVIYGFEESDGIRALALEFVDGETLADRIARAPIPLDGALTIARQMVDALDAAHQKGIIHRDFKPANIKLTPDGVVKVLDFGLAKAAVADPSGDPANSPTFTRAGTQVGVILGTAAYMAPEQARGNPIDRRADIWAFGCVLYEMLTGRQAFGGETVTDIFVAVVDREPDWTRLPAATPSGIRRLLQHCLTKDPKRRLRDIGDARLTIEDSLDEPPQSRDVVPVARSVRSRIAGVALLTGAAVAGALLGGLVRSRTPSSVAQPRRTVLTPITADSGLSLSPALSADGKLLAYASDRSGDGNLDIWVQQVGGGEPVRLTRHTADDYDPAFAPDGTQIVFSSQRQGGGPGVYVIPALSERERLVAARGRHPRFSPDGQWIAYWDADKTYIVPVGGGSPRQLAAEFLIATHPVWFPDGKRLLVVGNRNAPGAYIDDWYIVPIDDGGAVRAIGAGEMLVRYRLKGPYGPVLIGIGPVVSPRGDSLLFTATAGGPANLWQVRISPDTGQVSGEPEQLTFLASEGGFEFQTPSAALSGNVLRLAFWNVAANVDVSSAALDANQGRSVGQVKPLTRGAAVEQWASLSGDGKTMTYNVRTRENWDVWLMDLDTGRQTPLVVGPFPELWPKITRDGRRVAYALEDGKKQEIYTLTLGAAVPEKMCENCTEPWDWSSDGQYLLYRTGLPRTIGVLGPTPGAQIVLQHPQYSLHVPRFSPDDRWIAFSAGRSGSTGNVLFLAPFRGRSETPFGEWRIIEGSDTFVAATGWSPDGTVVYYTSDRDGSRCLWAQRLDATTKRPLGAPFEVRPFHHPQVRSFGLWQPGDAGTALAHDRMVFSTVETRGNIWMAEVK